MTASGTQWTEKEAPQSSVPHKCELRSRRAAFAGLVWAFQDPACSEQTWTGVYGCRLGLWARHVELAVKCALCSGNTAKSEATTRGLGHSEVNTLPSGEQACVSDWVREGHPHSHSGSH